MKKRITAITALALAVLVAAGSMTAFASISDTSFAPYMDGNDKHKIITVGSQDYRNKLNGRTIKSSDKDHYKNGAPVPTNPNYQQQIEWRFGG